MVEVLLLKLLLIASLHHDDTCVDSGAVLFGIVCETSGGAVGNNTLAMIAVAPKPRVSIVDANVAAAFEKQEAASPKLASVSPAFVTVRYEPSGASAAHITVV